MVFFSFIVFAFKLAAHSLTFFLGFYGRGNNTIGLGFVYTALSLGEGNSYFIWWDWVAYHCRDFRTRILGLLWSSFYPSAIGTP